MRAVKLLFLISSVAALAFAQKNAPGALNIYVIDVEGGNATLFVSPSANRCSSTPATPALRPPRDAGRIMDAIKDAGLTQIDHLIITHWHGDHFGGLAELAPKVPIREFIDHGPNVQPGEAGRHVPAEDLPAALSPTPSTPSRSRATKSPWRAWMCAW